MIIGIGGVSKSGKSTLAANIEKSLIKMKKSVAVFSQDDFVKSKTALTLIEGIPDSERPSSVKWDSLTSKIEKSTADVVIVEGVFSFYPVSIRSLYDKKIFVDIDKALFKQRKEADPNATEEPSWYTDHIWKSYQKYGKPKGDDTEYIFLDGSKPVSMPELLKALF